MKSKKNITEGCSIQNQTGLALLTIMVFLLILTLIGLSSMRTSRLEQMMSGNMQWSNIAFQAAETGLVESLENGKWVADVDPDSMTSGAYNPGEDEPKNIDYNYSRYFVDFQASTQRKSSGASSAVKNRKANFKTKTSGTAKEETSNETLATVSLEEGIYLIVPKP